MLLAFKRPTKSQQRKAHCIQKRASVFFLYDLLSCHVTGTHTYPWQWYELADCRRRGRRYHRRRRHYNNIYLSDTPISARLSYFCQFISLVAFNLYHIHMYECSLVACAEAKRVLTTGTVLRATSFAISEPNVWNKSLAAVFLLLRIRTQPGESVLLFVHLISISLFVRVHQRVLNAAAAAAALFTYNNNIMGSGVPAYVEKIYTLLNSCHHLFYSTATS